MIDTQSFIRLKLEEKGSYMHPTAELELGSGETPKDAIERVGSGTKIWRHCHVRPRAMVGEGCTLGQGVFVDDGVQIGSRVKIQNGVSVFSGVTLEDDVFVGPSAVFTNVRNPRVEFPTDPDDYVRTRIKKGATVGANATIVCGNTVGEYAFVGAGAVVTADVPDHALVIGVPAFVCGHVCCCGRRLISWNGSTRCRSCERTYEFPET